MLSQTLRRGDVCCRYGHDQYLALLMLADPAHTDAVEHRLRAGWKPVNGRLELMFDFGGPAAPDHRRIIFCPHPMDGGFFALELGNFWADFLKNSRIVSGSLVVWPKNFVYNKGNDRGAIPPKGATQWNGILWNSITCASITRWAKTASRPRITSRFSSKRANSA